MELCTLVVQGLARLPGAQGLEVRDRLGHDIAKEPDEDLPNDL